MARARLLCFPWAGGSSASYRGWFRSLPADLELRLVTPAGREPRDDDEPEVEDVEEYLAAVTAALLDEPALPLALFGHSFGGVMAYETAMRLAAAGRAATRLFISACAVPGRTVVDDDTDRLPDDQLVALMRERFGGLPVAFEASPDFMALVLLRVRTDLRLLKQCTDRPRPPLATPISVLWSPEDASVTEPELREWESRSSHTTTYRAFTGGHFYISAQAEAVAGCIAASLHADLRAASRAGVPS